MLDIVLGCLQFVAVVVWLIASWVLWFTLFVCYLFCYLGSVIVFTCWWVFAVIGVAGLVLVCDGCFGFKWLVCSLRWLYAGDFWLDVGLCGVCCFNNVVFGSLWIVWLNCFANGLRFDACCLLSALFRSLGWVFGV